MTLFVGIALTVAALATFVYSLPRGGKTARFVGSQWEGYVVVAVLCVFGLGLMLAINGAAGLLKG